MSKDSEPTPPMSDRMSSLLSEALGGREQVGGALDDVRSRLGDLTGHVAQLGERIDSLGASSAAATRAPAADLSTLEGRLEVLQNDMTALGGEVAGLVEANLVDRASVRAAVEAAESVANRSVRVEEVSAALADLRDGLVGPGGLALQVRQIAEDLAESNTDMDGRLDVVIQTAVRESEARMRAHVDDAVYALAEALLRRRVPSAPGAATSPTGPALDTAGAGLSGEPLVPTVVPATVDKSETADESAGTGARGPRSRDVTTTAATAGPMPTSAVDGPGESGWVPADAADAPDSPSDGPRDYTDDQDTAVTRREQPDGTTAVDVDIDDAARTPVTAEVGQPVRPARRIDVSADPVPAVRTLRVSDAGAAAGDADSFPAEADPDEAPHKRGWFRGGG